jgi:hypothetical protein
VRGQRSRLVPALATLALFGASRALSAQQPPPLAGPALAIQGGFSVIVPWETGELEWQIAYGAGFEYAMSHRVVLSAGLDHFGIENFAGRFGFTRVVLQPMLFSGGGNNPRLFAGLRLGHGWKSSRDAAVFLESATATGPTIGALAGSRSYLARTVAIEAAIVGDVGWFGDLVADGLAVYGTAGTATSLLFRVGVVLSLRGERTTPQ